MPSANISTAKKKKQPSKAALLKASKDYARKKVQKVFEDSSIEDHSDRFPQFEKSELVMGKLLGKGGFGTVKEIRGFQIHEGVVPRKPGRKGEEDPEVSEGEREGRLFIAEHCIRNGGDARYAVKYLSPEVVDDPGKFVQGITDMAIETRFLSSIQHTNIVKLRAIANLDPYDEEYFLVMDRLYDTLDKRMVKWASKQKKCNGFVGKLHDRKGAKSAELFEERLVFAFDLCCALEYMHLSAVIYRDVKPENIGFDVRGDIKIFDFGLAKELHPELRNDDGTYNLTENTGSIVYMAPEVALGKPYNDTADVYSMSILLFEMLALREAYPVTYTLNKYKEKVHLGHKRPKLDDSWPKDLQSLLQQGWHQDYLHKRLSMSEMAAKLKRVIMDVKGEENEHALELGRRQSSFQFRKTSSIQEN